MNKRQTQKFYKRKWQQFLSEQFEKKFKLKSKAIQDQGKDRKDRKLSERDWNL